MTTTINEKNIFIEGLQGAGKSTLASALSKAFPTYRAYQEGDISPVELAWCSYLTEEQYNEILIQFPDIHDEIIRYSSKVGQRYIVAYTRILTDYEDFHRQMSTYEIYDGRVDYDFFHNTIMTRYKEFATYGNVFECSFFQNSIECMMLFYQMSEEEIVSFYAEAYRNLKDKNFKMIYLKSDTIEENILQIKKERVDTKGNEIWFQLIMEYLTNSPYGKEHHYKELKDLVSHLKKRRVLELKIIHEVLQDDCLIVPSKEYELAQILDWLA